MRCHLADLSVCVRRLVINSEKKWQIIQNNPFAAALDYSVFYSEISVIAPWEIRLFRTKGPCYVIDGAISEITSMQ